MFTNFIEFCRRLKKEESLLIKLPFHQRTSHLLKSLTGDNAYTSQQKTRLLDL